MTACDDCFYRKSRKDGSCTHPSVICLDKFKRVKPGYNHPCLGINGKEPVQYKLYIPKKLPVSNEAVSPTLTGGYHSPLEEDAKMGAFKSSYGSEYCVVARSLKDAVVALRNEPVGAGLRVRIQAGDITSIKLPKGFAVKSSTHASCVVELAQLPKTLAAAFDAIA